jgi:hypothetical protein
VVEYLERSPETHEFWRHVRSLVDNHIEEYLRRSFTSLSIAFGCTGGQHRSVYFAERLAAHVRHEYPQVTVQLAHREDAFWPAPPLQRTEPPGHRPAAHPSTRTPAAYFASSAEG